MAPALMVKFLAAPMAAALARRRRRGAGRRAAVRLVRGAAVGRLSRDADAGLRADRLVDPVPVGRRHRRLQRHPRHLAAAAIRQPLGILSADPGGRGRRRAAAAPLPVRAVRLRHARRPRLAAARGSDRHQCQTRALDRLCHRRHVRRHGRRHFRLRQGHDLAGCRLGLAARSTAWSWCCSAASRP